MLRAASLLLLLTSLFTSLVASACIHTSEVPKLTLPWGTYEGSKTGDEGNEVYVFKNVRLRFAAPQYPEPIGDPSKMQDNSFGPNCIQAKIKSDVTAEPLANGTQSEDSLFLDIYVPAWTLEEDSDPLPVVEWIYGGAYIFGGKNTLIDLPSGPFTVYDGQGIHDASQNSLIWVGGNYRLGAYGFLAGSTILGAGQPNAGLHDHRLLLDFVQKYIGQVRGDKDAVNVWGLSAGAGSILHHLTAYGRRNQETPLFHRASLWSTAFQWAYDRMGSLLDTFLDFTEAAKCPRDAAGALRCLRAADAATLQAANQKVVDKSLALGLFPFGPAVDGDLVPDLPAVLLKQGKHAECSKLLLSHDFDEASMSLSDWVDTKEDFTKFVGLAFPGHALASLRKGIEDKYPPVAFDFNQARRLRKVLRDSTFVCNKRQLYSAYKDAATMPRRATTCPQGNMGQTCCPSCGMEASTSMDSSRPSLPDCLVFWATSWPRGSWRLARI